MLDLPSVKYIKLDSTGKPVVTKNKDYYDVVERNKVLAEKLKNNPAFQALKDKPSKDVPSMSEIIKKGLENG